MQSYMMEQVVFFIFFWSLDRYPHIRWKIQFCYKSDFSQLSSVYWNCLWQESILLISEFILLWKIWIVKGFLKSFCNNYVIFVIWIKTTKCYCKIWRKFRQKTTKFREICYTKETFKKRNEEKKWCRQEGSMKYRQCFVSCWFIKFRDWNRWQK